MPDTVTLALPHRELQDLREVLSENIRFVGDCSDGQGCEHAFHIVGDAMTHFPGQRSRQLRVSRQTERRSDRDGPASTSTCALFIGNFWHNTRYATNNAPHNILNLDGGRDHVVRGNIFADYNTPESSPNRPQRSTQGPTMGILIEQT